MSDLAPPIVGQDPWGADLNAYLSFVEARVATLEAQPNGAVMSFNFSPETEMMARVGFTPGEIRLDSEDQTVATAVMVSATTEGGADARLALSSAVPGTVMVLQQSGAVNQYALAVLDAEPVDMGDHFVLSVSGLQLASDPLVPGLTGLSAAGISQGESRPAEGPQGPIGAEGVQGPQGEPGPQGEIGPAGPQGETGAAGASTGAFPLQWKTNTEATSPAAGYVKANINIPTAFTEIYTSVYDKNGQALVTLNEMEAGDSVFLYEAGQISTWNRYELTEAPILNGSPIEWATLKVVFVETGPQQFTPSGNTNVMLTTPIHGEAGPPGPAGAQGVQGVTGPEGQVGPQGPQGPQGEIGTTGAAGPQGLKGDTGAVGAPGPQGVKGDKGDRGGSIFNGIWGWTAAAVTGVNAGRIGLNHDTPAAATAVVVHKETVTNSIDQSLLLGALRANDTLWIQQKTNAAIYYRYRLTGAGAFNSGTGVWTFPAAYISGQGNEPANSVDMYVVFELLNPLSLVMPSF